MINIIFIIATIIVLIYGAVIDIKIRQIPNIVPLALVILGIARAFFLKKSIVWDLALAICAFAIILAAAVITQQIGGGDVKLIPSVFFICGYENALIYCLSLSIILVGYSLLHKLKYKHSAKNIPLAAPIAAGYILFLFLKG
ncbi:MAG: prepilin peptidase [Oscillospiraceae bacterium]